MAQKHTKAGGDGETIVYQHCKSCESDSRHKVHLEDVQCPQHLHRVNHYVCVTCGNDYAQAVGMTYEDCVV